MRNYLCDRLEENPYWWSIPIKVRLGINATYEKYEGHTVPSDGEFSTYKCVAITVYS